MELESPYPFHRWGQLRPSEAPRKAGVGPGLEPGALSCSPCFSSPSTSSVLEFFHFLLFLPLFNLFCLYSPSSTSVPSLFLLCLPLSSRTHSYPPPLSIRTLTSSDHTHASPSAMILPSPPTPFPAILSPMSLLGPALSMLTSVLPAYGLSGPHPHLFCSPCFSPPCSVFLIPISVTPFPSPSPHPRLPVHMDTSFLCPCQPAPFLTIPSPHTNPSLPSHPLHSIHHRPSTAALPEPLPTSRAPPRPHQPPSRDPLCRR